MITPPFLHAGDKVAIVAPARKISPGEVEFAIHLFTEWGLKVVFGQHVFGNHFQFSGTDDERLSDLQTMLNDPSVKAIFGARGGYGTTRIIDKADFSAFRQNPKWIIGFSDITILHTYINQQLGIETLHAPMPYTFPSASGESLQLLKEVLFGETPAYHPLPHPLNRDGSARGILAGGNLSMLYAANGTSSEIETSGKVLFIEDLDEYLYHVDRMIGNLKRSGKLENLAGLVVGAMTEMKDNAVPFGKTAEEIIAEAVQEYDYPVCFGFPAGHIPDNRPLIMGRETTLQVSGNSVSLEMGYPGIQVIPKLPLKKFLKTILFVSGFFCLIYLVYSLIVLFSGK